MTRRRAALVVVGALLLSGCGVPNDAAPREISRDRVPFGLLDPDQPSSTVPGPSTARAEIFLVAADKLVPVTREVAAPATADKAVEALLSGPTNAEAARNLRTAIVTTSGLSASAPVAGLVTVELGRAFATSGASSQVLAVAQLVYTVTSLPGASRVSFTVAGRSVAVPLGDGTLTNSAVTRADFPVVAPA